MLKFVLAALLAFLFASCATKATDETPSGALRLFIGAMQRGAYDPEGLREAYELLDANARTQLAARAQRAGALANGREFKPWEMLVRGRFHLRFVPARGVGMSEEIHGERATITVHGERTNESARVPMARENGHWRVALAMPPMDASENPTP